MPAISFQSISKAYASPKGPPGSKFQAVDQVSLDIEQGEFFGLLGPNGAGKTTLMMSLAGILKPSHGSIKFEGQNLVGLTPSQIVQRGLALVPENRLVFPALTVRENLMAGAYLRKDREGIANDIEQQLHRFPRLRERIDQLAGTLSGGEQQMLALGRALMSRPRLLLMDEPSVGLAPKVVAEIFSIIRQLHQEGTSIFLVEQNVHMALKVAQHFYLLQQGKVTFSGTPDQLAEDDLVQRAYLAGHTAKA